MRKIINKVREDDNNWDEIELIYKMINLLYIASNTRKKEFEQKQEEFKKLYTGLPNLVKKNNFS